MSRYSPTGDIGVYKVADIVSSQLKWIFRPQPFADVGIDAIIEEIKNDEPTGKLIALQIKAGVSYFKSQDENYIYFRVEEKHFNYWSEFCLPIIVILHNPETELTYWSHFTNHNLINKKLLIDKKNILNKNTISNFQNIINVFTEAYIQDNFPDDIDLLEMYKILTKYTKESTQFIREGNFDSETLKDAYDKTTDDIENISIQLTKRRLTMEQCKRKEKMIMHNTKIALNVYSNKLRSRLPNYYNYTMNSLKFFSLILDETNKYKLYNEEFIESCFEHHNYLMLLKEQIDSILKVNDAYMASIDVYDSEMQRAITNAVELRRSYVSLIETIHYYGNSLMSKIPDEIKSKLQ